MKKRHIEQSLIKETNKDEVDLAFGVEEAIIVH